MNKNLNIAGLILLSAESYLSRCAKIFKDRYDFNNERQIDKTLREKDPALMDGRSHRDHIEKMFEILQFLIERADGTFPLENTDIEKMFKYFVKERISNLESEMLFELIGSVEKTRGYHGDEYLIGDHKLRRFIFLTCMCRKDYVTPHDYSPKSIRVFKDLFLEVNEKDQKIVLDSQSVVIKSVSTLELEGIETLWEIACQASNSIVQERAGYLLALIHYLYMDKKDFNKWEKETGNIVRDLMNIISTSGADSFETLNHVKVLKQFADIFETMDLPAHFRPFYKKLYDAEDEEDKEEVMESGYIQFYTNWNRQTNAMFAVEHKNTKEVKYIDTNIKYPVFRFKREVAKQFGIKARDFEFNYNDKDNEFVKPFFDWS